MHAAGLLLGFAAAVRLQLVLGQAASTFKEGDVGGTSCQDGLLVARAGATHGAAAASTSEDSRPAAGPEPPLDVFVVEQHGDVVRFWLEALGGPPRSSVEEPASLLHVDSHSDMMLPQWEDVKEDALLLLQQGTGAQELAMKLIRSPSIGDFVSLAMFAGLVSDVTWLRSDFPSGQYNGPAPGTYQVQIGVDSEGAAGVQNFRDGDEFLCFEVLEGTRYDSYWRLLHRGKAAQTNQLPVEDFDSCERSPPYFARGANVTVATLAQSRADCAPVKTPLLAHKRWILDVDLDFFSSMDPTHALLSDHGFDDTLLLGGLQGALVCAGTDDLPAVVHLFRQLVGGADGSCRVEVAREVLRGHNSTCSVREEKLQEVCRQAAAFTTQQLSAWDKVWNVELIEDWSGQHDFMSSLFLEPPRFSPHHRPSREEIEAAAAGLERLLTEQLLPSSGPPAIVTVARSMKLDHYLPKEDLELVERTLLASLRRVLAPRELRVTMAV